MDAEAQPLGEEQQRGEETAAVKLLLGGAAVKPPPHEVDAAALQGVVAPAADAATTNPTLNGVGKVLAAAEEEAPAPGRMRGAALG